MTNYNTKLNLCITPTPNEIWHMDTLCSYDHIMGIVNHNTINPDRDEYGFTYYCYSERWQRPFTLFHGMPKDLIEDIEQREQMIDMVLDTIQWADNEGPNQ